MSAPPSEGLPGYAAFLRAAAAAEEILRGHPEANDCDVAEGYLYLAGMWMFHLERAFKSGDMDRPCFIRCMDAFRTWGLPTPDHHYYSADIDGTSEYRVRGVRGNAVDFCFEVLSGLVGDDGIAGRRIDALDASRMHFDGGGHYEIIIGGPPRKRNWLRAGLDAKTIFVRQTANEWCTQAGTPMLIERIDTARGNDALVRPSSKEVGTLFERAGKRLVDQVRFLDEFARNWSTALPLNELPPPAVGPADAGYFPEQLNTKCRFELDADEALVVTIEPCSAAYHSLALGGPIWFNSIHPRSVQSSLNGAQSRLSADGMYRYVISPRDPGVPNWLDTGGHTRGFLFLRYQQVRGRAPSQPAVQRCPVAKVLDCFPPEPPLLTPAERSETRRQRRLSIDRRFF